MVALRDRASRNATGCRSATCLKTVESQLAGQATTFPPQRSKLGVDHDTVQGRVDAIGLGMRLADLAIDVRAEAALLPEHVEAEVFLEDFGQFDRVFDHMTLARQVRVDDVLGQVDAAGLRSLDVLSRQLHRFRPEPTHDENVRVNLIAQARRLRDEVAEDGSLDQAPVLDVGAGR